MKRMEYEPEKADEAVKLVCDGNYVIQKRMMLEIKCGGDTYLALNDLVIQRSTSGTLYNFLYKYANKKPIKFII